MGLFDELDVDVASAVDPFAVPIGMHLCYVTKAEMKQGKKGPGLAIEYTIDGGDNNGTKISEWKNVPANSDEAKSEDGKKALGWLKQRLASLGVPEERMNSLEPQDLVGIHCYVTVKQNGEYTNVNKVTVAEATVSTLAGGVNPFA